MDNVSDGPWHAVPGNADGTVAFWIHSFPDGDEEGTIIAEVLPGPNAEGDAKLLANARNMRNVLTNVFNDLSITTEDGRPIGAEIGYGSVRALEYIMKILRGK